METRIYVGNLSFETTEKEIRELFSQAGTVASVMLVKEPDTGQSKGFAVVEMKNQADADNAIQKFNRKTLGNREIRVILAWHRKGYSSSGYSRDKGPGSGRPVSGYGAGHPGRGRPGSEGQHRY